MLGTILEKLQGLFSKNFLIAAFFPVLIAAAVNALLLYAHSAAFHEAADLYLQSESKPLDAATTGMTGLIALGVVAFLFSILNTRLRETLEGRGWPRLVAAPFVWRQTDRLDAIKREYHEKQGDRTALEQHYPRWEEQLKAARGAPRPAPHRCEYPVGHPVAREMRRLRWRRCLGYPIPRERLQTAFGALEAVLKAQSVDSAPAQDRDDAKRLDFDQINLLHLVGYAVSQSSERIYRLSGEQQFSYPGEALLAPTALGNVAQSIQNYAYTRYRMNIDLFWTRLQKVMKDDPFHTVLRDAKTQLDCLVALVWFALMTVAVWVPLLALQGHDMRLYLAVAVAGPVAAAALYRLALQNYRAFADLVRAAIDLYRLELLKELKLAQPDTAASEAELWAVLNRRMSYASTVNVAYERPK